MFIIGYNNYLEIFEIKYYLLYILFKISWGVGIGDW